MKETEDGVILFVRIIPKASFNSIVGFEDDCLKIRIAAQPVKGAANTALINFLAKLLGVSKSNVLLLQGETSRHKKIIIRSLTIQEVSDKIKKSIK